MKYYVQGGLVFTLSLGVLLYCFFESVYNQN